MLHGTDADSFEHVDVNDIDTEAADNKARKFLTSVDSMSEEELLKHWRRAFMARHTTSSSMLTARHNESRDLRQSKGRLMTKPPSSIHFLQMAVFGGTQLTPCSSALSFLKTRLLSFRAMSLRLEISNNKTS
jgi:hypothetical protein